MNRASSKTINQHLLEVILVEAVAMAVVAAGNEIEIKRKIKINERILWQYIQFAR